MCLGLLSATRRWKRSQTSFLGCGRRPIGRSRTRSDRENSREESRLGLSARESSRNFEDARTLSGKRPSTESRLTQQRKTDRPVHQRNRNSPCSPNASFPVL